MYQRTVYMSRLDAHVHMHLSGAERMLLEPFGSMKGPDRPRYRGTLDDLRAAIKPFIVSPGWLLYQEKFNDKVLPDTLVAHKIFIRRMSNLCPNLSFTKAQLEAAFRLLVVDTGFDRRLSEEERCDWVDTSVKRLRVAFRHVSQARIRRPPPRWLAHIDVGDTLPDTMSQSSSVPIAGDTHGNREEEEEDDEEEEDEEEEEKEEQGADAQLPETEVLTCTIDNDASSAWLGTFNMWTLRHLICYDIYHHARLYCSRLDCRCISVYPCVCVSAVACVYT
jgi:hypothetical protein